MTEPCPHVNWAVYDQDKAGYARCTDCDRQVKLVVVLTEMARRVNACLGMVYARFGEVEPKVALADRPIGGRLIDEEEPP